MYLFFNEHVVDALDHGTVAAICEWKKMMNEKGVDGAWPLRDAVGNGAYAMLFK